MLKENCRKECVRVLGIFGASGLGREILETVWLVNDRQVKYEKIFFVDDNPDLDEVQGLEVLSLHEAAERYKDSLDVALAVGEPSTRCKIIQRVKELSIPLATIIHPGVFIPASTVVGKGCYIGPYSFISCNVVIGDYVLIQPNVNIGHDCVIEDNAVLSSLTCLSGNCHVGHDTYLAVNVTAIQGSKIGINSIIGMASVVQREVPDEVIAMGNPARAMKRNEEHRVFK